MASGPALIMAGYGASDGLQITVEAQQALVRARAIYAVAPPERLVQHLRSQRVGVVDIAERLRESGDAAGAYIDVAGFLLREATLEPPIGFLVPGNPLFLNSLARFLVQAAREREVSISIYPGVSAVDALVSDLGLDVTTRGMQVFDARHLVGMGHAINPAVPLMVLQMDGMAVAANARGLDVAEVHFAFAAHLRSFYPGEHPVTLILSSSGRGDISFETRPLSLFRELTGKFEGSKGLFVDIVRSEAS
jgi:uncharacterized protein YabN with tetrapyrrole methylase and pyrophosphatase domain